MLILADKIALFEFLHVCRNFIYGIYDLFIWYINLEIKLDIVDKYYKGGTDIIICNIVTK